MLISAARQNRGIAEKYRIGEANELRAFDIVSVAATTNVNRAIGKQRDRCRVGKRKVPDIQRAQTGGIFYSINDELAYFY